MFDTLGQARLSFDEACDCVCSQDFNHWFSWRDLMTGNFFCRLSCSQCRICCEHLRSFTLWGSPGLSWTRHLCLLFVASEWTGGSGSVAWLTAYHRTPMTGIRCWYKALVCLAQTCLFTGYCYIAGVVLSVAISMHILMFRWQTHTCLSSAWLYFDSHFNSWNIDRCIKQLSLIHSL